MRQRAAKFLESKENWGCAGQQQMLDLLTDFAGNEIQSFIESLRRGLSCKGCIRDSVNNCVGCVRGVTGDHYVKDE